MRTLALISLMLLLGCSANVRQAERATYDLGNAAIAWKPADVPVAAVSTQAPAWLTTPAIAYRLLYAGDMQRNAYADSRWAAPPADLIERALNRQTLAAAGGCRLRLDIDELIQVFETPQKSYALLDARATLLASDGETLLARRAFSVTRPAATPDARGGVAASAAAVQGLAGEIAGWLAETGRAKLAVAQRCSAG